MSRTDLEQEQRVSGFMETVKQLGGGGRIWRQELRSMEDTVSGWVAELANRKEAPTAVFVTNSFICQKIYAGLVQAGMSVPEDVSLLSFEENGELEHLPVPISVLLQPTRDMGMLAVDMLAKLLRNIEIKNRETMNCSLIIRKSVRSIPTDGNNPGRGNHEKTKTFHLD
ncbi:HTH-type transcriptional repressor PurR [bioreactor metagenome]|uniref:HTH-type transcriptional repressor PurR n=1 Tax=bioreactor metagenome TaxID=1076179 RepID=A0A645GLX1_9ZZZZ